MKIIKRICGILLLGIALLFVLRIPENIKAGGDKMVTHIVVDIMYAAALGLGALALLKSPSKPS